jgi:ABC-type branched-subunit amino acid transport system permease subunit
MMGKSLFQNSILVIVLLLVLLALSLGITFLSGEDLGSFGVGLISSLFVAMLLFLVASGLSIVFGLMDVLNLAQGAYFTVGAYVAWQVHHLPAFAGIDPNIRFALAVMAATVVGGILGIILERGLLQPLYSRRGDCHRRNHRRHLGNCPLSVDRWLLPDANAVQDFRAEF